MIYPTSLVGRKLVDSVRPVDKSWRRKGAHMSAMVLLKDIAHYCRRAGLAESTFGKLAVNDGKFVNRLREGGRTTESTLDRVRDFMVANPPPDDPEGQPFALKPVGPTSPQPASPQSSGPNVAAEPQRGAAQKNFRFFDNRQKYLLFVNTCSEKWVVAERTSLELANLRPKPPAVRIFDAGVGDGTVLSRVVLGRVVRDYAEAGLRLAAFSSASGHVALAATSARNGITIFGMFTPRTPRRRPAKP